MLRLGRPTMLCCLSNFGEHVERVLAYALYGPWSFNENYGSYYKQSDELDSSSGSFVGFD